MTPIETAARAAYESWISGVEGIEPAWDDLPQDFLDRLTAAQIAALLALAECNLPENVVKVGAARIDPDPILGDHIAATACFETMLRSIANEGKTDA